MKNKSNARLAVIFMVILTAGKSLCDDDSSYDTRAFEQFKKIKGIEDSPDDYQRKMFESLKRIEIARDERIERIKNYNTKEIFRYLIHEDSPNRVEPLLKEFQQRGDADMIFEEWLNKEAPEAHLEQALLSAVVAANINNNKIRSRVWRQTSLKMIESGMWWDSLTPYIKKDLVAPREELRLLESLRQEIGTNDVAGKHIAERMAFLERKIGEEQREHPTREQAGSRGDPGRGNATIEGIPEPSSDRSWWPGIAALAVLAGSIGFAWFSKRRVEG